MINQKKNARFLLLYCATPLLFIVLKCEPRVYVPHSKGVDLSRESMHELVVFCFEFRSVVICKQYGKYAFVDLDCRERYLTT